MYQHMNISVHCHNASQLMVAKDSVSVRICVGDTEICLYRPQDEQTPIDEWIELISRQLGKLVKRCGELSDPTEE